MSRRPERKDAVTEYAFCPSCEAIRYDGHEPDCPLAAALAQTEPTP